MNETQTENVAASARLSALSALVFVLDKQKPLDSAWPQDRYFQMLNPSDRAFAQLLVKTTLRRLGQIDALISSFIDRPLEEHSSRIKHILRLGIVQLMWLDTPPHAAVHSAVEMTKQVKMEKYSGLVNAVLKRVAKEGDAIIATQDEDKLNLPPFLWEKLVASYGEAKTREIAKMHLREPPLDITVKNDPNYWARVLGGVALPLGSVRLPNAKNITQLEGFSEGKWWIQDMAAAIPARLLGNVHDKRVIDLCAAPGGKTAQLASAGAKVSAVDVSKDRIAMLKTNVHRLQLQAEYITTDASKWLPNFSPDAILLDAPCSATGTMRRHPDVAWLRKPEDIERLKATQTRLLNHALDMLRAGGEMVYATCSLLPEEGEEQISALLARRKDVCIKPVQPAELGGLTECITKRGEIRTLPCFLADKDGMDGFYAAILVKK